MKVPEKNRTVLQRLMKLKSLCLNLKDMGLFGSDIKVLFQFLIFLDN